MRKRTIRKDLTGQRFGRLTVIQFDCTQGHMSKWLCKCDCGGTKSVRSDHLTAGHTKSCGCMELENMETFGGHNRTLRADHKRLDLVYRAMLNRCYHEKTRNYKNYGGRGIRVCDEWRECFDNFCKWALTNGYDETAKYGKCTLERIDVNGNYEPSNCKWVSSYEQSVNKRDTIRIEWDGNLRTIRELSQITGIPESRIRGRLARGWDIERTLSTPKMVNAYKMAKVKGIRY